MMSVVLKDLEQAENNLRKHQQTNALLQNNLNNIEKEHKVWLYPGLRSLLNL